MRLKLKNNRNYKLGLIAEYWAAFILIVQFYRILELRYKTKVGEIDIVARRGNLLHFIEVKFRPDFETGIYAVNKKSQLRIRRAAQHYMLVHQKESHRLNLDIQFDVIVVTNSFFIRHIKNAF